MKAFFKSPFFSYLVFIFLACSGALLWQFCFPQLAVYSAWGIAVGWQREIALWNIALIAAILYAFIQGKTSWAKPLTFQSTILCWALGLNHLYACLANLSAFYPLHVLGILEVMFAGGLWGTALLIKHKNM